MSSQGPPPISPQNPNWGQQNLNQAPLPPGKKSNVLLWIVGIFVALLLSVTAMCGIGGLLLYHKAKTSGFDSALLQKNPAYAAAKMAVTMAPNVETVSSDDDKGTITVRNKDDGKVMTLKFDPTKKTMVMMDESGKQSTIKISGDGDKGTVEINNADGSFKAGAAAGNDMPAWVPTYPGSSPKGTFSTQTKEGTSGGYSFKADATPEKVLGYYQDQLKSSGFTINMTTAGAQGGLVVAENKAANHTLTVTASPDGGGSNVTLMAVSR